MRIHRASQIGALLFVLLLPRDVAAQTPVPDYLVRVTLRDNSGERRLLGRLTSIASDSLMLLIAGGDSLVGVDRRTLVRVERRVDISIGRAMIAGCAVVGGILAVAGSQVHDPDSPGIEKAVAVLGGLFGCALGALGGVVLSSLSARYSWEEITV
jgi:hypothetical protein